MSTVFLRPIRRMTSMASNSRSMTAVEYEHNNPNNLNHRSSSLLYRWNSSSTSSSRRFNTNTNTNTNKTTNVSIVYGSFTPQGNAYRNAHEIHEVFSRISSFNVMQPTDGTSFDFNLLAADKSTDQQQQLLLIATSSMFGQPPQNFTPFAHNLLLAADTNPGCLAHLHHAVWGTGDPRWYETFMNVPRYTDQLLEKCGSKRIHARGEFGEPHLEEKECVSAEEWAERVLESMMMMSTASLEVEVEDTEGGDGKRACVPWNALWENHSSPTHNVVSGFTLENLMQSHGCLEGGPSSLAKVGKEYENLVEMFQEPGDDCNGEDDDDAIPLAFRARRQR
mmetsp:Transcript_25364/g.28449  ORF Transcript_25364/g.28449 Transcript_25364/m.28449 type:complete len:336 (+) Transcript_25364:73-1080(+)